MHHTKCAPLIRHVLWRAVLTDIGELKYSLLIDESTDVCTIKQMCIVIRCASMTERRVVTTFLGLESGTAAAITEALLAFLQEQKLDPKKCVGFVHIRCVFHSLQLCASYAIKNLPRNLEFLVAETYNYFSHSTLR